LTRNDDPREGATIARAPLLGVRDVAMKLGVSTTTVYRLSETRELGSYRVRAAVRFSEGDVAAYLAAHRASALPE
jgi:excisionase family DNA binding protein